MLPSPTIAFFDVDDTIIRGNSGFHTTVQLIKHHVLHKRRLAQAIAYYFASKLAKQDVKKIYQIAINDMAGSRLDFILAIGRRCFMEDILPRIYREALATILDHRRQGHHIILLTSAPHMTIYHLKDYLKADEMHTIGPVIENDILTDILMDPLCYAEGKLTIASQVVQRLGTSLAQAHFYSDSFLDLPLLAAVGFPHTVNPDRRLRRFATQRGWPILRFEKLWRQNQQQD